MFAHQDALPVGSWQLQIQGSKKWHICDPSYDNNNNNSGGGGGGGDRRHHDHEVVGSDNHDNLVYDNDAFDSQNNHRSDRSDVNTSSSATATSSSTLCYEVTINEGDVIYYPPYYWHQTLNINDDDKMISIALSNSVIINEGNLIKFIRIECGFLDFNNTVNVRDDDWSRKKYSDYGAEAFDSNNYNGNMKHDEHVRKSNRGNSKKYGYQFSHSFCDLFR